MEPVRTYVLTGATVIDGHGGAPLNDAMVFVENGVIKEVGSQASIKLEADIMKIDVLDMKPLEAITAATKHGAEACGIDGKVGTIEKGKLADLLVVTKDPVSNIDVLLDKENIRYVIKHGRFVVNHP